VSRALGVPASEAEVHVWTARLDPWRPHLAELDAVLTEDESRARQRYVRDVDREMFTLSRGMRRALLGEMLGCHPGRVAFEPNAFGKPRLVGGAGLRFNVSHSGDVALLAIALRDVGVDVEEERESRELEAVAASHFSPRERAALVALPEARRTGGFYACWSRKEAVIKAIGMGLSFPLDAFDVEVDPRAPPRLLASRHPALDPGRWTMAALSEQPGYAQAVRLEGPLETLREHVIAPLGSGRPPGIAP
jgi:4'-phosphopantetheinyl transferase